MGSPGDGTALQVCLRPFERWNQVFSVYAATDLSAVYTTSSLSSVFTFETRYLFDEDSTYYITFDDGVAVGRQSCGPKSAVVECSDFWTVHGRQIGERVLLFSAYVTPLTVRLTFTPDAHCGGQLRPVSCDDVRPIMTYVWSRVRICC